MYTIIKRIRRFLFHPAWTEEYFNRFIIPQIKRSQEAGVPQDILNQFWSDSVKSASAEIPPGIILRRLIDGYIEENQLS